MRIQKTWHGLSANQVLKKCFVGWSASGMAEIWYQPANGVSINADNDGNLILSDYGSLVCRLAMGVRAMARYTNLAKTRDAK